MAILPASAKWLRSNRVGFFNLLRNKKGGEPVNDKQMELFKSLTALQQRVSTNHLLGMSNREAYKAAGGKAKTNESIDSTASEILSSPKVSAFIDEMKAATVKDVIMTREEAMERLSSMARVSVLDIAEFSESAVEVAEGEEAKMVTTWRIKNSDEITREASMGIKSVTSTKSGPKLEMHDPQAAIKQLAGMQGWNSATKHDHISSDGSMTPTFGSLYGKSQDDVEP